LLVKVELQKRIRKKTSPTLLINRSRRRVSGGALCSPSLTDRRIWFTEIAHSRPSTMVGDENPNWEKGALERARSGVSIRYELIAVTPSLPLDESEGRVRNYGCVWESGLNRPSISNQPSCARFLIRSPIAIPPPGNRNLSKLIKLDLSLGDLQTILGIMWIKKWTQIWNLFISFYTFFKSPVD